MAFPVDGQGYRSVLRFIEAESKKQKISDYFMSMILLRVAKNMQKISGYELMSKYEKACWIEWHVWEEACEIHCFSTLTQAK